MNFFRTIISLFFFFCLVKKASFLSVKNTLNLSCKATMDKSHLPVFGIGPVYVIICMIMTILGLVLNNSSLLNSGKQLNLIPLSNIIGVMLIIAGIILWINAVIIQKISEEIKKGKLVTSGVYSIVRNPIYLAFLLAFTGILVMAHNLYLLILPFLYYILLTLIMKHTEEKWLLKKFGNQYAEYCNKVNRCIPWFPRKSK